MNRKVVVVACLFGMTSGATQIAYGQTPIIAPSTWAHITIDPQPRDTGGAPIGSPSAAAFDEWNSIPIAVTDPADNPSALNIIDIKNIRIANDADFIYVYVDGYKSRTNGVYLAFDTDQNTATGFNIYGLGLVGSELGFVNDFPFDQRVAGVFNNNKPDPTGSCCTGGPLDVNNGGAAMYPGWDVEFGQREWGISLHDVWSANAPFDPTFPNPTFNFIVWTDQGLSDVSDVISYTLATPPSTGVLGDYNGNGKVDMADYILWRDGGPLLNEGDQPGTVNQADYTYWRSRFGATAGSGVSSGAAVPEPSTILLCFALPALLFARRVR